MKLLIITQKVDADDPVLGFFHRWLEEFSRHADSLTVICLGKGRSALPANVSVRSLGKETKPSRLRYLLNFYRYIGAADYEAVFVHMNQEYVILGWLWWRLTGKRIYLWRNHKKGGLLTRLAVLMSDKVFCTSPESFTARYRKTRPMPVGIDTEFFKPDPSVIRTPNSVLFLGRIAPVKHVEEFIEALHALKVAGESFTATIAGDALPRDALYEREVRAKASDYGLDERTRFVGAVTQDGAKALYQSHEVYVNLTPSGSMDKAIFEAMSAGMTPVVQNAALKDVLPEGQLVTLDADTVARAIGQSFGKEGAYRGYVEENHSLVKLANMLFAEMA